MIGCSPGVTGRPPPQTFLAGHANSVLQMQAFVINTNAVTVFID